MRGNQIRETGWGERRNAFAARRGYFQSRARQLTSQAFERAIFAVRRHWSRFSAPLLVVICPAARLQLNYDRERS